MGRDSAVDAKLDSSSAKDDFSSAKDNFSSAKVDFSSVKVGGEVRELNSSSMEVAS